MKQIRLRIEVTAEDAVMTEMVQTRLTAALDALGTEHLPSPDTEDLGGPKLGPRIFWQTSSIRQGADRVVPEAPPRRKTAK